MAEARSAEAGATATLIGCGDLGARIGLRLASLGVAVRAVRRQVDRVPAPLHGIAADITDDRTPLPDLSADLLVVCLTADERDEAGYRRTYVEGMSRALEAATRAGRRQFRRRWTASPPSAKRRSRCARARADRRSRTRPATRPGR